MTPVPIQPTRVDPGRNVATNAIVVRRRLPRRHEADRHRPARCRPVAGFRQNDGFDDPSWADGLEGAAGVDGVVEPPPPLPPLPPSCPGQSSEAAVPSSAVNSPCGSVPVVSVGMLDPDEPVEPEPPEAIATVAQMAAATTTAASTHQAPRRCVVRVSFMHFSFLFVVKEAG
jgi:hypothetical protein